MTNSAPFTLILLSVGIHIKSLSGLTDSDVLDPNDSFSFTFENTGTFTYHDELNPSKFKGTIIVN